MTYIDEYRLAYGDDSDQTAPPDAPCAPPVAEQGSRASTDGIRSRVAAARTVARLERERDDLRAKVERACDIATVNAYRHCGDGCGTCVALGVLAERVLEALRGES